MRIVVTGATGNIGTSVLAALSRDATVSSIVGVARRAPRTAFARTEHVTADVGVDPLEPIVRGADAVVHLAWQMQPSHRPEVLERTNVHGTERVLRAAVAAGVPTLICASSVGAYAGGSKERTVDESWPTTGIPSSLYGRQKACVEALLDSVERDAPWMRVVRFRPALVFKREAASDVRRLVIGPLVPRLAFDRRVVRVIPDHPRLRVQAVHSHDVADAFVRALRRQVHGAFNLAADPVLDPPTLASILGARRVRVGPGLLRALTGAAWHLRALPIDPGWIDLAFGVPLIRSQRAQDELGWRPTHTADSALLELLEGLREGAGLDTPPLAPRRAPRILEGLRPLEA